MKNFYAIRRVLVITMILNLVVTAAKLVVGYLTGALSLVADGFDSLFDSLSNVIGLVGIYIAARPPDEGHPYGHRKAETLAALGISTLLFITCWELGRSAVERLRHLESITPQVNVWSFAALGLSVVVHLMVAVYEYRAGRRLQSEVLVADALHTKADIYISLAVVGGLIAVRLGYPVVDPLLALGIAVHIARIGVDIIRENTATLLDGAVLPRQDVERLALQVPGVHAAHRIRSRGPQDAVHVDLHILVDPTLSTVQAHALAHQVQQRLEKMLPGVQDVMVHVEPIGDHAPDQSWAGQEWECGVLLRPIGRVESPITFPARGVSWEKVVSRVVVDPQWEEGLEGLEEFSHIWVVFHLNRSLKEPLPHLRIHPKRRQDLPLVGVFATRSPRRPTPIAITAVRLLARRGNVLEVQGLDAYDGTPVLDIKPYLRRGDCFPEAIGPEWVTRINAKGTKGTEHGTRNTEHERHEGREGHERRESNE